VCTEETLTAHDHIWTIGPLPVYVYYVKPRADRDQQTGPSAHVSICHTYLTTCVICEREKVSQFLLYNLCPTLSHDQLFFQSDGRWCVFTVSKMCCIQLSHSFSCMGPEQTAHPGLIVVAVVGAPLQQRMVRPVSKDDCMTPYSGGCKGSVFHGPERHCELSMVLKPALCARWTPCAGVQLEE